jgi:hypothetical protein
VTTSRLRSPRRQLLDLGVVMAGCLGAGVLFVSDGSATLGWLGVVLVLFVPGYLVTTWLARGELAGLETLTLAISLSLAIVVLAATALATTAPGLTPRSFAGALLVLLVAPGIGIIVGGQRARHAPTRRVALRWRDAAALILGTALTLAAVVISVATATVMATPRVLQLYVEPGTGTGPPRTIAVTNQGLGLLRCAALWTPATDGARSGYLAWPAFSLAEGERWRGQLPVDSGGSATPRPVDITLSCQGADSEPLVRSLRLWLP